MSDASTRALLKLVHGIQAVLAEALRDVVPEEGEEAEAVVRQAPVRIGGQRLEPVQSYGVAVRRRHVL